MSRTIWSSNDRHQRRYIRRAEKRYQVRYYYGRPSRLRFATNHRSLAIAVAWICACAGRPHWVTDTQE